MCWENAASVAIASQHSTHPARMLSQLKLSVLNLAPWSSALWNDIDRCSINRQACTVSTISYISDALEDRSWQIHVAAFTPRQLMASAVLNVVVCLQLCTFQLLLVTFIRGRGTSIPLAVASNAVSWSEVMMVMMMIVVMMMKITVACSYFIAIVVAK